MTGKRDRTNGSPPVVRRLRLRGDWSDTGPDARPENAATTGSKLFDEICNLVEIVMLDSQGIGQARPQLHATLMQRMTDVLSQMLNDPMTRAALSAGGEDSLENEANQESSSGPSQNNDESATMDTEENAERANTRESETAASTSEPATSEATGSPCVSRLYNQLTTLRNLREGFIEQHGQEPSLSLRYSQQSTANATISLNVGDEIGRARVDTLNSNKSVPSTSQTQASKKSSSTPLGDETVSRTQDNFTLE